jgi:glucose/arabinose dehydrogenase
VYGLPNPIPPGFFVAALVFDGVYARNVLEVDVASGASRIYASGVRNPPGSQWNRQSGKLWAIVSERDEIGADLVPDYLTSGLVQDKKGALLIADDVGNAVWRVTAARR